MQKEGQNNLIKKVDNPISLSVLKKNNSKGDWKYGYNQKYDIVIISKDGTLGDIVEIQGVRIALPAVPKKVYARNKKKSLQYWEREQIPGELSRISSIFQWNDMPAAFKNKWVDYIEGEFDKREEGFWFMNNGEPTYITGSHYMYLQWSSIDVGYPDYREANRVFWIFWEACKADNRCFGMVYLKIRRSGFSFMGSTRS